ncbi:hypothetical protein [Actinoplanes subglobosus]|uniref:Uncharacterized protein n=1 Tax=Actinoplanes subglobosus TaxID=1547892 RepID=A0ABV8J0R9_9ACTN
MDKNDDSQDLLAVTSSLADEFQATEDGIAEAHRVLTSGVLPPTAAYTSLQHTAILNIAIAHRQECGLGCDTCDQIRIALENAVAAMRLDMEKALRELADRVVWTRAVGRVAMPGNVYRRPEQGPGEDTRPITRPEQ